MSDIEAAAEAKHRVVIIGAGLGGLAAARALRRASVEVTVVDRTNHHLFQALLYQVATGVLSEGEIAPPTRSILRRQRNARVLLGEVVDIDLHANTVSVSLLDRRFTVPYDSLIVAAGADQSYFGNDRFARYAPGMKTVDDALEIRGRIFGAFEAAELEDDPDRRSALLTFAIVGAGPTGVELAGQLAELSHRALKDDYRSFDPASARVVLLDAAATVLPSFPESLQRRAQRDLAQLGVELRLGTRVVDVDAEGLDLVDDAGATVHIAAHTKVWAAGVQASPLGRLLAAQCNARTDHAGRVAVLSDCSLPEHPNVFVVGDLMCLDRLPGLAQVAIQSSRHAAHTVARRLAGDATYRPFRYRDVGAMATISRFNAVGWIGRTRLAGFPGWLAWVAVHFTLLAGATNRLAALAEWTTAYIGRHRRQRTITSQQVFARERTLALVESEPRIGEVPPHRKSA